MELHSINLFFHIVGGLGIFIALGLEWTGLQQLRITTLPDQVRAWMNIIKNSSKLLFVSMLLNTITGILSMLLEEGLEAWITVTLLSFVLLITLAMTITRPRMAAIGHALFTENRMAPQTIRTLASQPLFWISIQTRLSVALGIVFLMIEKPNLVGSLLTIGVAIVLGLASTLVVIRRERAQAVATD
ncbi:MAG: hypothetical protein ACM3H7_01270 [Acidobacteriaceae bacterium]